MKRQNIQQTKENPNINKSEDQLLHPAEPQTANMIDNVNSLVSNLSPREEIMYLVGPLLNEHITKTEEKLRHWQLI